jgi:hypothetical protein
MLGSLLHSAGLGRTSPWACSTCTPPSCTGVRWQTSSPSVADASGLFSLVLLVLVHARRHVDLPQPFSVHWLAAHVHNGGSFILTYYLTYYCCVHCLCRSEAGQCTAGPHRCVQRCWVCDCSVCFEAVSLFEPASAKRLPCFSTGSEFTNVAWSVD